MQKKNQHIVLAEQNTEHLAEINRKQPIQRPCSLCEMDRSQFVSGGGGEISRSFAWGFRAAASGVCGNGLCSAARPLKQKLGKDDVKLMLLCPSCKIVEVVSAVAGPSNGHSTVVFDWLTCSCDRSKMKPSPGKQSRVGYSWNRVFCWSIL